MINNRNLLAGAALIGSAFASPAPQQLDFDQIAAAPVLPSGPSVIDSDTVQTATLYTSVAISGVATAKATATSAPGNQRRDATTSGYTPYYPALATGYTTDPALTATTTAGQACPTQPEAGTYCGFINPLVSARSQIGLVQILTRSTGSLRSSARRLRTSPNP